MLLISLVWSLIELTHPAGNFYASAAKWDVRSLMYLYNINYSKNISSIISEETNHRAHFEEKSPKCRKVRLDDTEPAPSFQKQNIYFKTPEMKKYLLIFTGCNLQEKLLISSVSDKMSSCLVLLWQHLDARNLWCKKLPAALNPLSASFMLSFVSSVGF